MGYDEQSQMWNDLPCVAKPNAPLKQTFRGVKKYLQLGIDRRKLILGVPWYGYVYPCISRTTTGHCQIKSVPFRGCKCSDAAGKEYPYKDVVNLSRTSELRWDEDSFTPYFDYQSGGQDYQIWFDDPKSLGIKYDIAQKIGLAGVGMWTANFLDYQNQTQIRDMWGAFPAQLN